LPTIIAVVAAALALWALIAGRFDDRQPWPAAQPVEIDDLRRQLEEVQRGTALREDLLLAEYEIHGAGYDARGVSVPLLPTVGIGYTCKLGM
jgi:nitrogen fixation-related uncharacterized protein